EHPGHLGPDDFDLAGAATGVVKADALLGPNRIRPGDAVLALASSGLHANGYSLMRQGIREQDPPLNTQPPQRSRAPGREPLTPAGLPAGAGLPLAAEGAARAFAQVPGGAFVANLSRVLPPGPGRVLARDPWRPPAIFGLLAHLGDIDPAEMERVFNMGIGMTAVVAATDADRALRTLTASGIPAWQAGEVTQAQEGAHLASTYRAE